MDSKLNLIASVRETFKILYVGSDDGVRFATLGVLQNLFATVEFSLDSDDALLKIKDESSFYNLILIDIGMDDSVEFLKLLRQFDENISILVLSSEDELQSFSILMRINIDGYILKPLDLPQFVSAVYNPVEKFTFKLQHQKYKQKKESPKQEQTKSCIDNLTGLKNRTALVHDLEDSKSFSALLLVDIDKFHNINEMFESTGGNLVLTMFSKFLKEFAKDREYEVYRLSGDSFVLRSLKDYFSISEYEEELPLFVEELSKFSVYLEESDDHVEFDVTVGISFEKQNALKKAEIALKHAKKNRRNFIAYNRLIDTTNKLRDARFWRSEIKQAISKNKIVPFFQPIVDREQKIVKYEVLMRLEQLKGTEVEFVSPVFFLNIAKQTKQYEKLTKMMIEKSFNIMKDLDVDFSVNLSFEDINSAHMITNLKKLIKRFDIGKQLIFEIVESEDIENYEAVQYFVEEVKELGVRIAIDDFGSGFSSYKRIFDIAPSFLKIDGSFIKNIDTDKNSYELVKSVVSLTKALDIKTIAEFVYSREIFDICYELGVEEFQGYYFSAPLSEEELFASLEVVA